MSEQTTDPTVSLRDFLAVKSQLEALQRASAPAIGSTIPNHGAGVDGKVASTWSAYDQALAVAGEHPHQRGEHADWLEYQD